MQKVTEYTVISIKLKEKSLFSRAEVTEDDFTKLINKKIAEGWQPVGGISITNLYTDGITSGLKMAQAMVKYN